MRRHQVHFRVTKREFDALCAIAEGEGTTVSAFLRHLIRSSLQQRSWTGEGTKADAGLTASSLRQSSEATPKKFGTGRVPIA